MKKVIITLLVLINAVWMCAQTSQQKGETEIRDLEERERKAMLNHDTAILQKMWAADFTVNAPFNRVTLSSRELFDMVEKGKIQFSSFTRNIEQVVLKKDIAVTMGSEEVVFTGDVPQAGQTIKRRFTNIWLKQNGVWRLTFRHANNLCKE